ncbi:MAG: hypothetical protein HC818_07525 [Synechococcaceae cyanobacterium RM1_1_27]|nr:hypothetical protein [Synechococcaceae cyanobacterium SM2_3_2]NJO86383.1 hypothetical protein [Synechococcaceae cyanobacterium RM1_1_27]
MLLICYSPCAALDGSLRLFILTPPIEVGPPGSLASKATPPSEQASWRE